MKTIAAVSGVFFALFAIPVQAQELAEIVEMCGGVECICMPLAPNEGPPVVVMAADVQDGAPICAPGYVLVSNAEPASIAASPQ